MSTESLLPDRVTLARERASLSRANLAAKLGVSEGALAKWERGEREPSVSDLCRLADALAVTVAYLLGRDRQRGRLFTKKGGANTPSGRPKGGTWPCKSKPGGCDCHCHALVRRRPGKGDDPRKWEPEEDARLRDLLTGGCTLIDAAERLGADFGKQRTPNAVRIRATFLGLSTRDGWWTRAELRDLLGVPPKRLKLWEDTGILHPEQNGVWRRYHPSYVEQFVREQAGLLLDPRRVRDRRLRGIAETSSVVNRRRAAS